MSAGLTVGQKHPYGRATARKAFSALCKAWATFTLKRMIAEITSMSDHDCRELGMDKAEILAVLSRLRREIKADGVLAAGGPGGNANGPIDHPSGQARAIDARIEDCLKRRPLAFLVTGVPDFRPTSEVRRRAGAYASSTGACGLLKWETTP